MTELPSLETIQIPADIVHIITAAILSKQPVTMCQMSRIAMSSLNVCLLGQTLAGTNLKRRGRS